jgi:hypothetical protein
MIDSIIVAIIWWVIAMVFVIALWIVIPPMWKDFWNG